MSSVSSRQALAACLFGASALLASACADTATAPTGPALAKGGKPRPDTTVTVDTTTKVDTTTPAPAPTPAPTPTGSDPIAPQVRLGTAPVPTTGRVLTVASNGNLQAAIDSARLGDEIRLAAGATYSGNFVLRAKAAGTAWITIRTSSADSLFARPGVRVSPTSASRLARIVTPNANAAIATAPSAHHYRLVGLEVANSTSTANGGLVTLGTSGTAQTTLAQVPSNIILDRVYVHAVGGIDVKRCVALNSASSAVIDSYLSGCDHRSQDSQAIGGWNGPGPFRIANNHLEGGAEIVMFGGADPSIPNLVPSDVEIVGNHLTRSLAAAGVYVVKNLFELKNAQRMEVSGNVLEHNWASAQVGFALVWKSVNQSGGCTWCVVQDIDFHHNKVRKTAGGLALAATAGDFAAVPARRIALRHNVFSMMDTLTFTGTDAVVQFLGNLADVTLAHNTVAHEPDNLVVFAGGTVTRLAMTDNVLFAGTYGIKGTGATSGTASLTMFAPGALFAGNVIGGASAATYPVGNSYPATISDVGFTSWTGGLFALSSTSLYRATGTDGRDPGADVAATDAATAGVDR